MAGAKCGLVDFWMIGWVGKCLWDDRPHSDLLRLEKERVFDAHGFIGHRRLVFHIQSGVSGVRVIRTVTFHRGS